VEVNGGVSFGNESSGVIGVEGDWAATRKLTIFAELGHAGNVTPGFTNDSAEFVAGAIGTSVDVKSPTTYFDVGVKYLLPTFAARYQPYAGIAFGVAHVTRDSTFSVNGSDLSEDQLLNDYGVQLGADLADSTNRAATTILLGVQRSLGERYGVDVAYRYSHLSAKTDLIEDDKGTNMSSLQFGFLIRF
jgi:opacity protein-like surface antigen